MRAYLLMGLNFFICFAGMTKQITCAEMILGVLLVLILAILWYRLLTFRERLIIALAGNPNMIIQFVGNDDKLYPHREKTSKEILAQADAIIKEMEGRDE